MTQFYDAFISYGRNPSKEFATKLHARLVERGYRIWFDQEDIPPSVDYQQQIDDGIERAHNFLFIISPRSVESEYCAKELDLALDCGKRIIPLLHVRADRDLMNPELRKRNWIYFQEGDDFEKAFEDLVGVFETQKDYVQQHTHLFTQALAWQRNHRELAHLLEEAERQRAEAWLYHRFQNALPPCAPSDLHCEYITESMKDACDGMTQVFLSYASEDKDTMERVRRSLQRQGITVWINTTDIGTGENFEQAIRRGIEGADNLVYLLSPAALQSAYCQQELDYALSLHKRIVPVRVKPIAAAELPDRLHKMQFIDLRDNTDERNYQLDESELLQILKEDAAYYEQHKVLLVKALQWERQERNPNFLLWGYNLRIADAWLAAATRRSHQLPTSLQVEFIEASLQQPPTPTLDAFLFYPQSQVDFARKLNRALQAWGKRIWFDRESIASGADLQQEIYKGIEQSENFICILSANWGDRCPSAIEYALKLNKRFVPILAPAIALECLPSPLKNIHWVDFSQEEKDFDTCVGEVIEALEVDREHTLLHTKWLQRSLEWQQQERSSDLLLRGSELEAAEQWLAASADKEPRASLLQFEYIRESRRAETTRQQQQIHLQRWALGGVTAALAAVTVFGALAIAEYRKAAIQEIRAIALSSQVLLQSGQPLESLVEGIRARHRLQRLLLVDNGLKLQVKETLQQAIFNVHEYNRLPGEEGDVYSVALSPDGAIVAASRYGGTVSLWRRDGTPLPGWKGQQGEIFAIAFSPDSQTLATAGADRTVKLWQRDGTLLATLQSHTSSANSVAFSPDGQTLASASSDRTIKLWRRDGRLLNTLTGHGARVDSVAFSPDGATLASGSDDGMVKLWQRDGTLLATLEGHQNVVNQVAFSPDGERLASASDDGTVKLWQRDRTLLKTLQAHEGGVLSVAFSPDSETIATGDGRGTVRLWQQDGSLTATLTGHGLAVSSVAFSPDGKAIASASFDTTVRLWRLNPLVSYLNGHSADVGVVPDRDGGFLTYSTDNTIHLWDRNNNIAQTITDTDGISSAALSPDGQTIAATSETTNSIKLWQRNGTLIRTIASNDSDGRLISFSADGQELVIAGLRTIRLQSLDGRAIATYESNEGNQGIIWAIAYDPQNRAPISASEDGTIALWQRDGTLSHTLDGHPYGTTAIAISPDGKTLVSGGWDKTVKLWQRDGTLLATLKGHDRIITAVAVSPNGELFASGSIDNMVKLWRRDGTPVATLRGKGQIISVAFSVDGNYLAAGDRDGRVVKWDVSLLQQAGDRADLTYACDWVRDYLQHHPDPKTRNLCNDVAAPVSKPEGDR